MTYIIREGDYIWALARRFKVSPYQILELNHLKLDDLLRVGQKLLIPANGDNYYYRSTSSRARNVNERASLRFLKFLYRLIRLTAGGWVNDAMLTPPLARPIPCTQPLNQPEIAGRGNVRAKSSDLRT